MTQNLSPAVTPETLAYSCGITVQDLEQLPGKTYERLAAAYAALGEIYDSLPTTSTPADFIVGHGNWGLTEHEYKVAIISARELINLTP